MKDSPPVVDTARHPHTLLRVTLLHPTVGRKPTTLMAGFRTPYPGTDPARTNAPLEHPHVLPPPYPRQWAGRLGSSMPKRRDSHSSLNRPSL